MYAEASETLHKYYAHQIYVAITARKTLVAQLMTLRSFVEDEILQSLDCVVDGVSSGSEYERQYISVQEAINRTEERLRQNERVIRELADRYIEVATYVAKDDSSSESSSNAALGVEDDVPTLPADGASESAG